MRNREIKSLAELQLEISQRKHEYLLKETVLKADAKAYIKQVSIFDIVGSLFKPQSLLKLDEKTNLSGGIMSLVLPLLLNKTLFKGSGFLTKSVAALVSGKIGKSLDAESLSDIFNKTKSVITSFLFKKKKKENTFIDYGIPPDSETY